jgi:hypothetical protein
MERLPSVKPTSLNLETRPVHPQGPPRETGLNFAKFMGFFPVAESLDF